MKQHTAILIGAPRTREELQQMQQQVKHHAEMLADLDANCPSCEQCQPEEQPKPHRQNTPLSNVTIREIRQLCTEAQALGFQVHNTSEGIKLTHHVKGAWFEANYPDLKTVQQFLEGVSVGRTTAHLYSR